MGAKHQCFPWLSQISVFFLPNYFFSQKIFLHPIVFSDIAWPELHTHFSGFDQHYHPYCHIMSSILSHISTTIHIVTLSQHCHPFCHILSSILSLISNIIHIVKFNPHYHPFCHFFLSSQVWKPHIVMSEIQHLGYYTDIKLETLNIIWIYDINGIH